MTLEEFFGLYNYWVVVFLMMTGFYIVIARKNMIKTVIGLNIFQVSVVLLYVTMGKVTGGTAPIIPPSIVAHSDHSNHSAHSEHSDGEHLTAAGDHDAHHGHDVHDAVDQAHQHAADAIEVVYSNPLPSVLMLTAIVVGIATTALALALIVRISEDYGTIEEDEILKMDRQR
jgi:multicomponent Na+:H+ antiporter subunit C